MDSFMISVNAVVPIFLMMILGYLSKKIGIIGDVFIQQATKFVFRISLPFMIFIKVASIDLEANMGLQQLYLMMFIVAAIILAWLISEFIGKALYHKNNQQKNRCHNSRGYALGAFVQGSFRSNFLIIGYPVLLSLYGDKVVVSLAIATLVVIPSFNVLAIIALSGDDHGSQIDKYKAVLIKIMTNPLIISIVLGFVAAWIKLPQPEPIFEFVNMVGKMATPLGLIAIGAFFHFDHFKETMLEAVVACGIKLTLLPLVMSVIAYLIGFGEMEILLIVVLFGGPTAVSSFAMASEMGGDPVVAGNIVILSSSLCVFTYMAFITLWLSLLA